VLTTGITHTFSDFFTFAHKRIRQLMLIDPTKGELMTAALCFLFGVWLSMPFSTFSLSTYVNLTCVMSERNWGGMMVGLGLFQGSSVFMGCTRTRRVAAMLMIFLWGYLTLSIGSTQPHGLMWLVCGLQTVSSAWSYIQVAWYAGVLRGNIDRAPFRSR